MNLEPAACEQLARPFGIVLAHIEKRANPLGPEEQATDVAVGFHGIRNPALRQQSLESQGTPQRARDMNEFNFDIVEELGWPPHARRRVDRAGFLCVV